jgi:hypothetical protein
VGFGSGELEHVPSRSKHLKAPLVEDSEGVVGRTWTGGASSISGDDHADVRHGGANCFTINSDPRSSVLILIEQPLPVRSREQRNDTLQERIQILPLI